MPRVRDKPCPPRYRRVCDAEPVLEATVTAWQPLTESPLFVRWRDCIEHALCKPMIHFIQSTPHLTRYLHWLACSLQSVADVQRRRPRREGGYVSILLVPRGLQRVARTGATLCCVGY